MTSTRDFDILKVFADTKESLQKGIEASQGRLSLLDELEKFFTTNNLKVVQVVEEPEEEKKSK